VIVITNSRKYAIRKLLAMRLGTPLTDIVFVTTPEALAEAASPEAPPLALMLWQRGRLSEAQRALRNLASELDGSSVHLVSREEVVLNHD